MRSRPSLILIAVCTIALAACGRTYVTEEIPNTFEMPAGTTLEVKLVEPAHAADIVAGEPFDGILAEPLYYRRQELDPEGKTFEKETLVAVVGSPVAGVGVAVPEAGVGLKLESVTFHGGMSFPVETDVIVPPAEDESSSAEAGETENTKPLTFSLTKPADVALAIDYRENDKHD